MTTPGSTSAVLGAVAEGSATSSRMLSKLRHDPAGIAVTLAVPVVLVLMFGYLLGSAIPVPGGGNYREFLVPGLMAMLAFNVTSAMVMMARDAGRGVIDRFRSMPITRVAIPFGQATAQTLYGAACLVLIALCGLAVGWRIRNGPTPALEAVALLVAFQFAATWLGMYLGLIIGNEQTAAQLSILVFPFAMISNIFVPTTGMPTWLQVLADWNPLSALSTAARTLCGNPSAPTNGAWPLEHPSSPPWPGPRCFSQYSYHCALTATPDPAPKAQTHTPARNLVASGTMTGTHLESTSPSVGRSVHGHATPPKLGSALISPTYVHLLPLALDPMRPVRDKSESVLGGTSSLSRESIPGPLNQPMGLGMG